MTGKCDAGHCYCEDDHDDCGWSPTSDVLDRLAKLEAAVFPSPSRIREQDVRCDIYRGAGTAVIITHVPTGIKVGAKGEINASQLRLKAQAYEDLEAKLADHGWEPTEAL